MSKLRFIILIFLSLLNLNSFGQDPHFSQFFANPLYLSPSFAGSTAGSRAILNFRDQWPAIPGAFVTYAASLDHYLPRYNSGIGIQFIKDQAGSGQLGLTTVALSYSYRIKYNRKWSFRPALMLNYNIRSIDFYRLRFNDQMNINGNSPTSIEIPSLEKVQYPDAGFSFTAISKKYWGGFMLDHIFNPNQSLINGISPTPLKLKIFGGKKFIVANAKRYNEETIKLQFLYQMQGEFDQLELGAYWTKEPFIFGLWYRGLPFIKNYAPGYINNDAFIILVGYKYQDITFNYSYDVTISRIFANTAGSHEISLIYEFNQNQKVIRKQRALNIPCAKF